MDEGAVSNKRKRRRCFRFSLRTLMLVVLAAALGSAFVGRKIQLARQQYLAGVALETMGAVVRFEPAANWTTFLVGDQYCPKVTGVDLDSEPVCEEHFSHIAKLEGLTTLLLFYTETGDEELRQLKALRKLKRLYLNGTPVTDNGVVHLLEIDSLAVLNLNETRITDEALRDLRRLPNLMSLEVENTNITDAGLEYLRTFPKLEGVYLSNTQTSREGIAALRRERPDLFVSWGRNRSSSRLE